MLNGLRELPYALRWYLLLVIAWGIALPAALAMNGLPRLDRDDAVRVILLLVLAAVAERFTLHLTHKTAISVANAPYLAMILIFPSAALCGTLVFLGTAVGHLGRRRSDPTETLFNAAQTALAFTAAALVYGVAGDLSFLGPDLAGFGSFGAVVLAAAVAHSANGLLVAGAAGLQLRTNPVRVWLRTFADDLPAQAVVAAVGVVVAYLAVSEPVLAPVLVLPLALVHVALRENVRLRVDTHQALADLVEVVELRDPYTAGHSRRVAELSRALALRLGLTHEEADLIEDAGKVHDLGKVAIDPVVLTKPGKLTEDEYDEMKRHPGLGADVIARFASYQEGVPIVRHHHEGWTGQGYPDGLHGDGIPLGARILAVADTFDALTSDRPYRPGMSVERALTILTEGAGVQWDPRVVAELVAHVGWAGRSTQLPATSTPLPAAA